MCYEWGKNGAYSNTDQLADLDYKLLEQIVLETAPAKPKYEFFGGEPLLYKDLFSAISLIKASDCKVDFPSNGVLLHRFSEEIVNTGPDCIWVSLDGPPDINDKQRGKGVFDKAWQGIVSVQELKRLKKKSLPQIGVTFVVTLNNYEHILDFFTESVDIGVIDYINIEFQRYITKVEFDEYKSRIKNDFNVMNSGSAYGFIQSPEDFSGINFSYLSQQINNLKIFCRMKSIPLSVVPDIASTEDIASYFSAGWEQVSIWEKKCFLPWIHAEISANGDVTVCPAIYDFPPGNVYQKNFSDIWNGDEIKNVRKSIRRKLLPICYACCRHYQQPQKKIGMPV